MFNVNFIVLLNQLLLVRVQFCLMFNGFSRHLPKTKRRELSAISSSTAGQRPAACRQTKFSWWLCWTWWNIRSTRPDIRQSLYTASMSCQVYLCQLAELIMLVGHCAICVSGR